MIGLILLSEGDRTINLMEQKREEMHYVCCVWLHVEADLLHAHAVASLRSEDHNLSQ